jgi:hypothetical protein
MKTQILAVSAAIALAGSASAATLDFGTLTAGSDANGVAPAGTLLSYAALVQNTDINGDPIPGSFSWQTDGGAGSVLVQDPSTRGHGSGPVALDAVDQPVLLTFTGTITLTSFSGVLDHGPLSGGLPSQSLIFADSQGNAVDSKTLDYTQSGLNFNFGPISGVHGVVLPSGRYVEKISFVVAPEVNGQVAVGSIVLLGALVLRRFKR